MAYPTTYPYKEFLPLPSDQDLGEDLASFVKLEAQDLKDGRMMLAAGLVGTDMIKLAKAVFVIPDIPSKIREFICLRICKHVGGVNPWGPNLRMLKNLDATDAEIAGLQNDGPVTGMDADATLIMKACDELTLKGCVQDNTLAAMKAKYDTKTCFKYILVLSWYNMFNRYVVSTRVPVESAEEIEQKIGSSSKPA